MRLSGFHMPRWWQSLWRRRYPLGPNGVIEIKRYGERYRVVPMPCGCGYRVFWAGGQIGNHSPTLGGALRKVRRHVAARMGDDGR